MEAKEGILIAAKQKVRNHTMTNPNQVIQDLKRVVSLIRTDAADLSAQEKEKMAQETIEHFNHYVSPGWLQYRKSVSSDTDSGAVLEWQDEGPYC